MAEAQTRVVAAQDLGSRRTEGLSSLWLGAFVTAALTIFFFSFFWNRFVGLRSGTGSFAGGAAMFAGTLPYRDFFSTAPPLNGMKSWVVLSIFGNTLATLRAFDVLERTALGLLVYFWLARFFRVRDAAIAAIVTIIASACDFSDPVSSYNHEAIFLAVAGGYAATLVLGRRFAVPGFVSLALLSGLCAALSLCTKQTIGLGASVAIPFVATLCLLRLEGWRRAALFFGSYSAGWWVAIGLLLFWLSSLHILPEFFDQLFVKGPSAKASSPLVFITRYLQVSAVAWWAVAPALVALGFTIPQILTANTSQTVAAIPQEKRQLWLVLLAGAMALTLGVAAAYAGVQRIPVGRPAIFFSLYATAVLLGYYLWLYVRQGLTRRESECCLLAAVSFSSAVMLALSWPALHTMLVPALAFPLAAILQQWNDWRKPLVYAICFALLAGATLQKLNDPFDFDDFYDPPAIHANSVSTLPQLRGMRLPESTVRLVDGTVRIVQEHSSASDTIFAYPEFAVFYALTNRKYPTLSGSHNIDVINDEFALSEARRLLATPPAVLIYSRPDESDLLGDEKFWRGGRRSGQRDLIAAIEELLPRYKLAGTFDVPPNITPVKVYTRQ